MFRLKYPCDPSDLVHFRHRIGEAGVEKILAASILIHGEKVLDEAVSIDTTVPEKNITYPGAHEAGGEDDQEMPQDSQSGRHRIAAELQIRGQGIAADGQLKKGRRWQSKEGVRSERSGR